MSRHWCIVVYSLLQCIVVHMSLLRCIVVYYVSTLMYSCVYVSTLMYCCVFSTSMYCCLCIFLFTCIYVLFTHWMWFLFCRIISLLYLMQHVAKKRKWQKKRYFSCAFYIHYLDLQVQNFEFMKMWYLCCISITWMLIICCGWHKDQDIL